MGKHHSYKYNVHFLISLISFLKAKYMFMRSPSCLSVYPYQLLNQLVDFYEIQYRGHALEGDQEAIIFNVVTVIILKWQMFKLLR
jgi:hypothetical protein